VRSRSRAVLLALAVLALAPSLGVAQYAPKWHVGDWWVVKTCHESQSAAYIGPEPHWTWDEVRYEVTGVERVNHHNCFVLKADYGAVYFLFYVLRDSWLIIRYVTCSYDRHGKLVSHTHERPGGAYGAYIRAPEPRLLRFPLQLGSHDTLFKLTTCWYVREVPGIADSALLNHMLYEGDSALGHVVRPNGTVYEVRSETPADPPQPDGTVRGRILQSLQLWSEDLPWRLYEGLFTYYSTDSSNQHFEERSWLTAVGHSEKPLPQH
jgi:hypothetical protein